MLPQETERSLKYTTTMCEMANLSLTYNRALANSENNLEIFQRQKVQGDHLRSTTEKGESSQYFLVQQEAKLEEV